MTFWLFLLLVGLHTRGHQVRVPYASGTDRFALRLRESDEAETLQSRLYGRLVASGLKLRAAVTLQRSGPRIRRSRWGCDRLVASRPDRRAVLGAVRLRAAVVSVGRRDELVAVSTQRRTVAPHKHVSRRRLGLGEAASILLQADAVGGVEELALDAIDSRLEVADTSVEPLH